MIKTLTTLSIVIAISGFSVPLSADEQQKQMRKPPQEAYTVCEDKSENETVKITTPDGQEITATCQIMADKLVAIPENHKPPQRQKR